MMGGLAMTAMSEGTDDSARATEEGKLEEEELQCRVRYTGL
jgi:hypothetical protein